MHTYVVQTSLKKSLENSPPFLVSTSTIQCKDAQELEKTVKNLSLYLEHKIVSTTDPTLTENQKIIKQ